jgi:hypothetical protein
MTCAMGNPGDGGTNSVSCCDIEFHHRPAFPDAAARPAHVYLVIKNPCPVTAFVTLSGYDVAQGCEDLTLGVMPEVVGRLRDMEIFVPD